MSSLQLRSFAPILPYGNALCEKGDLTTLAVSGRTWSCCFPRIIFLVLYFITHTHDQSRSSRKPHVGFCSCLGISLHHDVNYSCFVFPAPNCPHNSGIIKGFVSFLWTVARKLSLECLLGQLQASLIPLGRAELCVHSPGFEIHCSVCF